MNILIPSKRIEISIGTSVHCGSSLDFADVEKSKPVEGTTALIMP